MARKLFNPRQRAQTTNESMSQPTTSTDASAQSDLQPLGQVSAKTSNNTPKRSNTLTIDVARSHQLDDHSTCSSNAPSRPRTSQGPEETHLEEEMIGIALGSPTTAWGMGYVASIPATMTDMSDTETDQHSTEKSNAPALRRKPSKWKKFGDLFKPKAATVPAAPADTPFYQVKINDQAMLPARYPDFIKNHNTSDNTQNQAVQRTRSDAQKGQTRFKKHAKLTKGQSPPPQKHWGGMSEEPAQVTAERDPPPTNFLGVDIPDVELERYSVMFGSLLGKNPSPTLLARRSRTLDQLKTQEEEGNLEVCTENRCKDMALTSSRISASLSLDEPLLPRQVNHRSLYFLQLLPRKRRSLWETTAYLTGPRLLLRYRALPRYVEHTPVHSWTTTQNHPPTTQIIMREPSLKFLFCRP